MTLKTFKHWAGPFQILSDTIVEMESPNVIRESGLTKELNEMKEIKYVLNVTNDAIKMSSTNSFSGGNLGVFCGASFLSFVEIIIWSTKLFASLTIRTNKYNGKVMKE
jgi:hypothetical protein